MGVEGPHLGVSVKIRIRDAAPSAWLVTSFILSQNVWRGLMSHGFSSFELMAESVCGTHFMKPWILFGCGSATVWGVFLRHELSQHKNVKAHYVSLLRAHLRSFMLSMYTKMRYSSRIMHCVTGPKWSKIGLRSIWEDSGKWCGYHDCSILAQLSIYRT